MKRRLCNVADRSDICGCTFLFLKGTLYNACAFQCKMQFTMHINWMVHRNKLFQILQEGNYLNNSHNKKKLRHFHFNSPFTVSIYVKLLLFMKMLNMQLAIKNGF